MPKSSAIQGNFNGGEISPLLFGRPDVDRYGTGLEICENFIPLIQGPAERRPGTHFVVATKNGATEASRLITFEFSETQTYGLEFGNLYIRFVRNRAQIVSGTPVEVVTPYLEADLFQIKTSQSADIMYIAHPSYAPRTLSRLSDTSWVMAFFDFEDGPFLNTNATDTTLGLSGTSGSVTVTASSVVGINGGTGFVSTDVGRLLRWRDPANNWTWLKITAHTSTTIVTATILGDDASASTATVDWRLGVWSDTTGWPATVTFHQDRLTWGGGLDFSQRTDASRTGDFNNMSPTDPDGTVVDDHAIAISLSSGGINNIVWLEDDEKGLIVGTAGGEWIVRPNETGSALTPTNIQAKRSSTYGSKNLEPVRVGKSILFVQRSGLKVRDLAFVFEDDGFRAPDMTLVAEHITAGGIVQLAYQAEPQSVVWAVRGDGVLLGLSFVRDQNITGWHRHILGGVSDASGAPAKVESVISIPNSETDADEVLVIVQRFVDGVRVRHIEYLNPFWRDTNNQEDAEFADSTLTLDDPQAISGLTQADPAVATVTSHPFSNGDEVAVVRVQGMTEVNGTNILVADQTTNAFSLVDNTRIPAVISGVTQTNPVVVTAIAHGLANTDVIGIFNVVGPTALNGLTHTVINRTDDTFELSGVDGTGFSAYVSDGDIHPAVDSTGFDAYITAGEARARITSVGGLAHLEGESVAILADGAVRPNLTVSAGAITLAAKASVVQVGLGTTCDLLTLRNNSGAADGTAQGKTKRIHRVIWRFHQTQGGRVGPDADSLDSLIFREGGDPMDTAVPLFTGDVEIEWDAPYDKEAQIHYKNSQPVPVTIVAIMPQLNTQDR